jgi:alpha-L-arabinofuranosidase
VSDNRTEINLGDGQNLTINITGEGIIMDVVEDDYHLGTVGMMFDEWADWVVGDRQSMNKTPGGVWSKVDSQ